MRIDTLRFLLPLLLGSLSAPLPALARVTANVPVDSPYYDTVDKLSAMGYLQSLPNGARPYSRQQLAGWAMEAEQRAETKPLPGYLADELRALETYVAPEMDLARGKTASDPIRLRQVSAGVEYRHGDVFTYEDRSTGSSWGPFSQNRNGHKLGRNGMATALVEASGNLGSETAVSLRGRAAWDRDNEGTASLEEGYLKTRTGAWAWEAGREALTWGQGAGGHLLLGNNMKPLTLVQTHLNEPVQAGGFLKFLGQVDFHAFYGRLDGGTGRRCRPLRSS
jgi:hypothetical protein